MREFTPLHTTIWTDQHFITLSNNAQLLYLTCISHPTVNYAGIVDWRPKRLAMLSATWTVNIIEEAARELEEQHYLVIDRDTEECFVRSMFRNDSYLKQANLGTTCANDCRKVASPKIHTAIKRELRRLYQDRPHLKGWRSSHLVGYMHDGDGDDDSADPVDVTHNTPNITGNLKVDPEIQKIEGQILKVKGQIPESNPQIQKTDPQNQKVDPQIQESDPEISEVEGEIPKVDPEIQNARNLQLATINNSTTSTFLKSKSGQKFDDLKIFPNKNTGVGSATAPPTSGCWRHRPGPVDDCEACRRKLVNMSRESRRGA